MFKPISADELAKILESHRRWWEGEEEGAKAYLTRAYLTGANLAGANLAGANLARADLTRADLTRAYLIGANLAGADLTGANLIGANLTRANLFGADLIGANLTGAKISWSSHALIAELLWRAAGDSIERQMLSAWVGRNRAWCWKQFLAFAHPERDWALDTLAVWVQDGDQAPEEIRARAAKMKAVTPEGDET